ncbi:MAG: TrkH family potassium uptake protein, partial [Acholeplasmatales bacterium]
TSASALSVTGLSSVVIKDVFTPFGLFVMLFIIQFGGVGLTMMITLFWLVARKKIGFKQRNMIMTDQNQLSRKGIVRFMRNVLIMIFTIELIAFVVLTQYLYFSGHFPIYREAAMQGLFLAISLFTNAGFDIAPGADSFQMFRTDYFMQSAGMLLMLLGSIGFWTLAEIKEWIVAKLKRETFTFSYFVRLLIVLHLGLWLFGATVILFGEHNHFLQDKGVVESIYYALFMSLTTRNAGFSTMSVSDFTDATQGFIIFLMFVGANPNSNGGGIRTTTLILVVLALIAFARDKRDVIIRKRTIKPETVYKALIAFMAGITVVSFALFILKTIEPMPFMHLLFEVTSAFGTTGLSLGITPELSPAAKFILVVVMFIGRLGIVALLLMFRSERSGKKDYAYPQEDVIVG